MFLFPFIFFCFLFRMIFLSVQKDCVQYYSGTLSSKIGSTYVTSVLYGKACKIGIYSFDPILYIYIQFLLCKVGSTWVTSMLHATSHILCNFNFIWKVILRIRFYIRKIGSMKKLIFHKKPILSL
jgi:hypothetical protein